MLPTDWLPFYPDLPPRPPRVRAVGWIAFVPHSAEAYPVADLLAGLTFLPSYPDCVPHTRTTREQTTLVTGAIIPVAVYPLVWLPTFPDQVAHRRPPTGPSVAEAPPGTQVVIAQWLAWQAKFPDRVPHRRLLPPAGEFSAINPVVAAGGEPCVDLALDTLDSPALIAQVLTAAGVLSEGLASPALINEDLC